MAQRTRSLKARAHLLARRYGLTGNAVFLAACLGLVVLLAGAGYAAARSSVAGEMVIERDDGTPSEEQASLTQEASSEQGGYQTPEISPSDSSQETSPPPAPILVHVDGAVANPGVYELAGETPRINDVVVAAGGLAPEADTTSVNLAAPVADGQKVHIPLVGETPMAPATDSAVATGAEPTPAAPVEAAAQPGLVNVNTATREELMTLTGVGEATAAAIIEEREANGPFASPDDLVRVSGIGEKKLAKIRGDICV